MPNPPLTHDAAIVGAGVSGLLAARDLARKGIATVLVDDGYLGGLVVNVGDIEGPPPFGGLSGADLVNQLLGEALEAGVAYEVGAVTELVQESGGWRMPDHPDVIAGNVVLATGASLRQLGVPGETEYQGRGVSQCAYCDGALFRGQDTVVVGGGDAAFQEALHLAKFCRSVTMVIRSGAPRARADFQERLKTRDNVRFRYHAEVTEIIGEAGVEAVRVRATDQGGDETLTTQGVFPFVGTIPRTDLAPTDLPRDLGGGLVVDATLRAARPGLYAIGAVRAGYDGTLANATQDARTLTNGIA